MSHLSKVHENDKDFDLYKNQYYISKQKDNNFIELLKKEKEDLRNQIRKDKI